MPEQTPTQNHLWKPTRAMTRTIAFAAILNAGLAIAWTIYL